MPLRFSEVTIERTLTGPSKLLSNIILNKFINFECGRVGLGFGPGGTLMDSK